MNEDIRLKIAEIVYNAKEGHIPSAYSIVEILSVLYGRFLRYDSKNPKWEDRDYFILSKGHGCAALYAILHKYGFITQHDLDMTSKLGGILGGHPDCNKIPGVEASTGSLGHGLATGIGIALGLRILHKKNRVVVLIGDGECNEGTIWESALVASNLKLGNLCVIIDENKSSDQILPMGDLKKKWESFGWNTINVNGHSEDGLFNAISGLKFEQISTPNVIIADTVKGKGVSFIEGHWTWHHKVPSEEEFRMIRQELGK